MEIVFFDTVPIGLVEIESQNRAVVDKFLIVRLDSTPRSKPIFIEHRATDFAYLLIGKQSVQGYKRLHTQRADLAQSLYADCYFKRRIDKHHVGVIKSSYVGEIFFPAVKPVAVEISEIFQILVGIFRQLRPIGRKIRLPAACRQRRRGKHTRQKNCPYFLAYIFHCILLLSFQAACYRVGKNGLLHTAIQNKHGHERHQYAAIVRGNIRTVLLHQIELVNTQRQRRRFF